MFRYKSVADIRRQKEETLLGWIGYRSTQFPTRGGELVTEVCKVRVQILYSTIQNFICNHNKVIIIEMSIYFYASLKLSVWVKLHKCDRQIIFGYSELRFCCFSLKFRNGAMLFLLYRRNWKTWRRNDWMCITRGGRSVCDSVFGRVRHAFSHTIPMDKRAIQIFSFNM